MGLSETIWANPTEYLRVFAPDHPVIFFSPAVLQATARRFVAGFPGQVTYAVKSNPSEVVLSNLSAAGINGFDVASIPEIETLRRIAPGADLHYNNPVRSPEEIRFAVAHDVKSYSVDSHSELDKLIAFVPAGKEIAVRFKLVVDGAAYDFGSKFGAAPDLAIALLQRVAQAGYQPALTFHPGTQCTDPAAWDAYIREAGRISAEAGVAIARLNVGGGFPSHRLVEVAPDLEAIFERIDTVTGEVFGDTRPALVCEPGRGMVAESHLLATRVKAIRDGGHVFLNDGVYGAFSELPLVGKTDRALVLGPAAAPRNGAPVERIVFGPTCDSVDRLPGELHLPDDMKEGDYVLFAGLGAYSVATATRFNGFGAHQIETVHALA